MIDPYIFDEALKWEREEHARYHLVRAQWAEREPKPDSGQRSGGVRQPLGGLRRRLARTLMSLADHIQACVTVPVPYRTARSTMNGTYPHACRTQRC
jgi:hypothetical protein